MSAPRIPSSLSWSCLLALFVSILSLSDVAQALNASAVKWVQYTESNGATVYLQDDRQPALYTQDFGDCQGDSQILVSRFDAAYYADNMTVIFHLAGTSQLLNESIMLYIGVYAYGRNRFDLTFNPCDANIYSLCPANSSVPIEASGIIPVASSDISGIPKLALSIPDFEGQAILRIFSNSTQSQIGCYSAVVTNGSTFSHPAAVGTVLGAFALVALLSSAAVAMYGEFGPETRKHYAHSASVFVVFSVFQHIFYTGALSMNWPSVLPAFWSNYAWSAGMIYSSRMQNSINKFIGSNGGNISMVGAAQTGAAAINLGGGYQISQIYKRAASLSSRAFRGIGGEPLESRAFEHMLARRALVNSSSGFSWYGSPVRPGLPLPGNFSGFAGTLGQEKIPASNAFLTGLLWFVILLVCIVAGLFLSKWILEALWRVRIVKTQRLAYFRTHWIAFMTAGLLRTCFIGFFMFMFLTTFQFTLGGPAGAKAIAAIVFLVFLVGLMGVVGYALFCGDRLVAHSSQSEKPKFERKKIFGIVPWYGLIRLSNRGKDDFFFFVSASTVWLKYVFVGSDPEGVSVHEDMDYTRKFGWLSARFRRSKWWFFAFWLVYEFVRACFYGGAAGHPLTQVFGLLAVEFLALVTIFIMKPFEGNRLNLVMVYFLGFSKVTSVALSSAFDTRFDLDRIITTVIAIVIIVIQGILTILLMVFIVLGAISSYMSLTRNREKFKPKSWAKLRTRYFAHLDKKATDCPAPPRPPTPLQPEVPKEPYFKVASVRREPKIEDDDAEVGIATEDNEGFIGSKTSLPGGHSGGAHVLHSRAQSVRSQTSHSNLPYGARPHRASWSSRDFAQMYDGSGTGAPTPRMSQDNIREAPLRPRSSNPRAPSRTGTPLQGRRHASTPTRNSATYKRDGTNFPVDRDSQPAATAMSNIQS